MTQPTEAYIIDAVRTPVCRYGGALKEIRPITFLQHTTAAGCKVCA